MIEFEVKSKTQPIGKRKGQTVYFAQPVSQQHLTNKMVVDRIAVSYTHLTLPTN